MVRSCASIKCAEAGMWSTQHLFHLFPGLDTVADRNRDGLNRISIETVVCNCGHEGVLMSATSPAGPSTSSFAGDVARVKEIARRLRILSMMSTTAAGSGHPT